MKNSCKMELTRLILQKTDWKANFVYTIEAIHGIKGACFVMACMTEGQKSSVDMMMYYDTRPSPFNGAYDFYTLRPLKGYYPRYWYGMLYDMKNEVRSLEDPGYSTER